jgi:amidase
MDTFAFGGTGDLQEFGSTLNPADPDYLAGGSSSGSAAAVAAKTCDIGLGTDQAGSVRGPSAWCGCVGMKPTHGLVPYTGGFSTDRSLDHIGTITRTIEKNARALGAIAGPDISDGVLLDPRQRRSDPGKSLTRYAPPEDSDLDGLTVGVVAEGFDRPMSDPGVDRTVREAIDVLVDAGAQAREVSLPSLKLTAPLMNALVALSVTTGPFGHGGIQTGASGWHWTRLATAISDLVADRPKEIPLPVVVLKVIGTVLTKQNKTVTYAEGKNAALAADRRIRAHLKDCDVLALPTTPMTAFENRPELLWLDRIARNADALVNTALFNHTGHPALTVPCGTQDGLPVGLQLVGPHHSERKLYTIAAAV